MGPDDSPSRDGAGRPIASARAGVIACLAAGAIWGGIFVGPRMLPQFDAPTFSLARYLCFGLLSCALVVWAMANSRVTGGSASNRADAGGSNGAGVRALATPRDLAMASWLGLVGNLIYFIALVSAIQRTGIAYAHDDVWDYILKKARGQKARKPKPIKLPKSKR